MTVDKFCHGVVCRRTYGRRKHRNASGINSLTSVVRASFSASKRITLSYVRMSHVFNVHMQGQICNFPKLCFVVTRNSVDLEALSEFSNILKVAIYIAGFTAVLTLFAMSVLGILGGASPPLIMESAYIKPPGLFFAIIVSLFVYTRFSIYF